jgi:TolB protein
MDADGGNQQRLTNNRKNELYPSWSPDGNRIAFSADRKGDRVNFEIYVMDADGGNQQRLTNNRIHDRYPSWSPDGKRIAFSSEKDGNWESLEIYVMDADGGNPQNLTNNPQVDVGPAWLNSPFSVSPAGKQFTMWGRVKQVDQ